MSRPAIEIGSIERVRIHDRALTPKETELLVLLCKGHVNKTAAFELGISERTTEIYRQRIMDKLNASSPVHLGVIASRKGLV